MAMEKQVLNMTEDFFAQFQHKIYKKREILVRAEESPAGVFYLKSGSVKQYFISKNGEEVILNIFKASSFFPMSWAINHTSNLYFFEALTDVEVWCAPQEKVIKFIKSNSNVLYDLVSRIYKGTDGMLTRMAYLMSGSAHARLVTELLIHAKRFGQGSEMVEIVISEKDLALQSGMTRETVSREMRKLKTKNIISLQQNKLIIQSISRLEEELLNNS